MQQDSVDRHIEHWSTEVTDLDPLIEGVITRMQLIVKHLKRQRQSVIEQQGLEGYEFETLHVLGGCLPHYRATPTEIATWLRMSPAAITGRIDALERRGYVRRLPVAGDRRKVLVELTDNGHKVWLAGLGEVGVGEQNLTGALNKKELEQLNGYLRRMLHVVDGPDLTPTPITK